MKVKGKITIVKPTGRDSKYIQIDLIDSNSHLSLSASLSLEGFADAITGKGYTDCEIEFPDDFSILGKTMEVKSVALPYVVQPTTGQNFQIWFLGLINPYEAADPDWVADRETSLNHHKLKSITDIKNPRVLGTYTVTFRRWV